MFVGVVMQSEQCRLTSLDLTDNELGEAGAKALGAALQSKHYHLTSLNIGKKRVGGGGLHGAGGGAAVGARSPHQPRPPVSSA
jgi:hypothetical protein